jgi:hypothetical protein
MIDWRKPIEDMNGNPAHPISKTFRHITDRDEPLIVVQVDRLDRGYSVLYIADQQGRIIVTQDGKYIAPEYRGAPEIRNVKVKKEGWQNIHRNLDGTYEGGMIYKSEVLAGKGCVDASKHVATIKVQWEE